MPDSIPGSFYHPRYWLIWLGLGVLWLMTRLPWRFSMAVSAWPGRLLYRLLPARRRVSCINLAIAFPKLSSNQRNRLNQAHFRSATQGLFEAALSWWGADQLVNGLIQVQGEEHLQRVRRENTGVILLSAHFTSLELGGRMLVQLLEDKPLHVVYRPHQNPLLEVLVASTRSRRYGKAIARNNIREMVRSLKKGHLVWYAPDQAYTGKSSVDVEFFGQAAATNSATSRLSRMTGATVVPFFTCRDPGGQGYILRFLPPLENFPGDDEVADTQRINAMFETQIREFPEQYLWTHKRYKNRASDFYGDFVVAKGEC